MAAVVPLRRALRMVKEENAKSQYSTVLVTFSPQGKQKSFPWLGQSQTEEPPMEREKERGAGAERR